MSFALRGCLGMLRATSQFRRAQYSTSCSNQDTTPLFDAISKLNPYGIYLKSLPVIVVVGPQSSGKTTLISAICKRDIFPTGNGMTTNKPMFITTLRSDENSVTVGTKVCHSDKEASDEIDRQNHNSTITAVPVTIRGGNLSNINLVDNPGLISVSPKDRPRLSDDIKQTNIDQLQNPNVIPVIVHAALTDPANNQAIDLLQRMGLEDNAYGIITKIDVIGRVGLNNANISKLLKGNLYPLGHGYCPVILNSENTGGVTSQKLIELGQEYHKLYGRFGVDDACKTLSGIQFKQIKSHIPALITDIDKEVSKALASETILDSMMKTGNHKFIDQLTATITKLVSSSPELKQFQSSLKMDLRKAIQDYLEEKVPKAALTEEKPGASLEHIDSTIVKYHSKNSIEPRKYKNNAIKDLFSNDSLSFSLTRSDRIDEAYNSECYLGATLPLFKLVIDDPENSKEIEWKKQLHAFVGGLLDNDNMQNSIQKITIDRLIEYIHSDSEGYDEGTKQFMVFMINEIGNESFASHIRYSITTFIRSQKSVNVSITEMVRHLAQIYPKTLKFQGKFWENCNNGHKIPVEVYGSEWTVGYFGALSDRLVEYSYSVIAVNYLSILVNKILEKTMDMCRKGQVEKEKNKMAEKIAALNELKSVISKYNT